MSKTLIFLLALSLLVVFTHCKDSLYDDNDDGDDDQDGDWISDGSGDAHDDDDDDGDDDDWVDGGSGLSFNWKKHFVRGKHRVRHRSKQWKNKGHQIIHLKNCFVPNCMNCRNFNCRRCMPGYRLKRQPFALGKRCVAACPFGKRDANGRCQNNVCKNVPHCRKCQKFPWTRSCIRCENGWYRYKAPYQMIAKCVNVCPRGYRATNGTRNFEPTCEKIPSFCYNAPHCLKCQKFPWTRSCMRCENGWYRYKAPYQTIANCVKVCPRGYRANNRTRNLGPTCEKIPSFCYNAPHCLKCQKFPWTRSCIRCEKGWYRYKAPYQMIAKCVKACPRGYRANTGNRNFSPTCEKIPSCKCRQS